MKRYNLNPEFPSYDLMGFVNMGKQCTAAAESAGAVIVQGLLSHVAMPAGSNSKKEADARHSGVSFPFYHSFSRFVRRERRGDFSTKASGPKKGPEA